MTVPASYRKTSSMQYIDTAERLASKVLGFTIGLRKRLKIDMGKPLFDHAEEMVYHCRAANLVYVNSDETFARRRDHLLQAEGHLLHVETLLGILHFRTYDLSQRDPTVKPPNENVYREFAELIEQERKLISGCKRRDTQAYNRRGEAGR